MSNTHIPERTCIICRAKNEKSKLFRLAKVKEAFYEFDKEQKKQSRAVYVCKSLNCLGRLAKHNKIKLDSQDLMSMLNIINKANKHFIVMAQDISKKNEEKVLRRINELKIPYVVVGTMQELGKVFNKEEITVIGIKDKKMARGLIEE